METGITVKKYITILSIFLFLILLAFLSYRFVAPFGKVVLYRFLSKLPEAEEAVTYSAEKGSILKIPSQIIRTPQSRFSLELLSADIESAKATLKFKKGPKEIKLGVRGNEEDSFYYQPLYHSLLQDLDWEKIEEAGFILWQKVKKYSALYDFVNNPPQDEKIASYFVDQDKLLLLTTSEVKEEAKTIIETSLRGNYSLLVRVDRKPLILGLTKQDMNAYQGEDKVKIAVLKEGNTLKEETIKDDGITDQSQLKTGPQEKIITLEDVEPGIYQVDITFEGEGYDSLITTIEINQEKTVFKNNLFLLGEKSVVLWTDAQKISFEVFNEKGLQTVILDDKEELEIDEIKKGFSFDLESLVGKKEAGGLYKLEMPKNNIKVIIGSHDYLAFSKDSFFNPEMVKSVELSKLSDLEDIDHILTTCPQAKSEGDWLVAEASFDPKKIKIKDNKLYFSLEMPELSKYGGELEIDYLEIMVKSKGVLETEEEGELSPSPTPAVEAVEAINILVKVLNGGAGKGAAGKFVKILQENGFTNTKTDNADRYDYEGAIIRYRKEEKGTAEKIVELLKEDYKTIIQKEIATTSAEIVIIIGEK